MGNTCEITNYTVVWYLTDTGGEPGEDSVNGNSSKLLISGLTECSNYTVSVTAATMAGAGDLNDTAYGTTLAECKLHVGSVILDVSC